MNDTISEQVDQQQDSAKSFYSQCIGATLEEGTYFELLEQTLSSLDILPKFKNGKPEVSSSRHNTTVYSILNQCRTACGARLLTEWLRKPLIIQAKIELRLDIVEFFYQNSLLRTTCYDSELRKIPDLMRIAFLMKSKNGIKIEDLVKIHRSYEAVESIRQTFEQITKEGCVEIPEALTKLFSKAKSSMINISQLIELIENSIYVDKMDADGHYVIKPGSDSDMAKVYVELETLMASARRQMDYVADDIGLEVDKGIKLEADKDKGFALKVSRQKEQFLRENKDYHQVTTVKKDGYRFANKALSKLSTKYVSAKSEYNSLSLNVIKDILSKASEFQGEVQDFSVLIALLDVFTALATAALDGNYSRPTILPPEAGKIRLDSMRHPCIESQPDVENYVPNDIILSKDDKKFYVITGPNMGGKSTFIKSVAISVIMAQCGSMIPAESSCLSITDGVYTRIGAGDKQMEGISTFMEEMLDMSYILQKATENSLVVIDELGRGTSTFDGFGLSWSISKTLAERIKCYTLFATHFHELTELENESQLVGNLHVKALCDDEQLIMLFNIEKGACGQSYGINVAKFTKFPEHIVTKAQAKLRQYEELPGFSNKEESRQFVSELLRELSA